MSIFIKKRVLHILLVLVIISLLSFLLANIAPIDPAEAYARRISKGADRETIQQVRKKLGFNQSIIKQYLNWLKQVIRLDFGNSYISHRPVLNEMLEVLPITLLLALIASIFILVVSVLLGVVSALKNNKIIDKIISVFSFIIISIPSYFLGLLILIVFGIKLNFLPIIGHGHPLSIFFGAMVLSFPMIGTLTRIIRSLILDNNQKDYVLYARARGVSEKNIIIRYLLLNCAPTCITLFGQNLGYLVAGTAIVETIFSCPGFGRYALMSAINRDFPVINAYILVMAIFFVLFNLIAEICGMFIDPRLKRSGLNE